MKNIILTILIVFLLAECKDGKDNSYAENKTYLKKVFVPSDIQWKPWDSSLPNYGGLNSSFITFHFSDDSTIYSFKSLNSKKLTCIDTSIFNNASKVYEDTSFCYYEDSILFGIENVEMFKGKYSNRNDSIYFDMKSVAPETSEISIDTISNHEKNKFVGNLKLIRSNNKMIFLFNGQQYIQPSNFKKESYRRLFEYIDISDKPKQQ
jgi:hypothetical protein